MMITLPTGTSTAQTLGHSTGRQHPGAEALMAGAPHQGFDDVQHALVEARMTTRLSEAGTERLTRRSRASDEPGVRGRIGRALIGLGTAIAGPAEESSARRTS